MANHALDNDRFRASLAPRPRTERRPLWSVMIPTYHCASMLEETLASVLAQDPGPDHMQIEVIDDASTRDNPQSVVERLGAGRVSFYRQPGNIGHVRNFETCLRRSRGFLVHLLHGDDFVRPGFYDRLLRPFLLHPRLGAAFCRHDHVDATGAILRTSQIERDDPGLLDGWLETIAGGQRIQAPSIVVRRRAYETLRLFDRRFVCSCEDWEMWARIASRYPVSYEPANLAAYREHEASLTGRSARGVRHLRDARRAMILIGSYLPAQSRDRILGHAGRHCACWALKFARANITAGYFAAAGRLMGEAIRCHCSPTIIYGILRLGALGACVASRAACDRLVPRTRIQ